MIYSLGCHAIIDLAQNRALCKRVRRASPGPGIERDEFNTACQQLAEAGYGTKCDDETWQTFSKRRTVYAGRLNVLARYFAGPPTRWIGDRTVLAHAPAAHFDH